MFNVEASLEALDRQDAEGTVKVQEDLDRYRWVINQTRPTTIIECGTYKGGSARWFEQQGLEVITIDWNTHWQPHSSSTITLIEGNTTDVAVAAMVSTLVGPDERVMVSLDSSHDAHTVHDEILIWSSFVSFGCYLVVEDGIVHWMAGWEAPGPLDAIAETLMRDPHFEVDALTEQMYPVTMFPGGWWRRIK